MSFSVSRIYPINRVRIRRLRENMQALFVTGFYIILTDEFHMILQKEVYEKSRSVVYLF